MHLYERMFECLFVCVAVDILLNVCIYLVVLYVYLRVFVLFVFLCTQWSPHSERAYLDRKLRMVIASLL